MKKAMISQPMAGLTHDQIEQASRRAAEKLHALGFSVKNTTFTPAWYRSQKPEELGVQNPALFYLSKSLEIMSTCEAVYFCKGWALHRGCRIEHKAAMAYGLKIIEEASEDAAEI